MKKFQTGIETVVIEWRVIGGPNVATSVPLDLKWSVFEKGVDQRKAGRRVAGLNRKRHFGHKIFEYRVAPFLKLKQR